MSGPKRLARENRRLLYELTVASRQVPHLRALVEGSSDMLALTTLDGLVLEYNSAFALVLDSIGAPLEKADLLDLFCKENNEDEALLSRRELSEAEDGTKRLYGCIRPSREPVEVTFDQVVIGDEPALVVSARRLDEAAKQRRDLISAQGRVQELNNKLIQERDAERSLRMDSLSVLAGALAHDLNNALAIVLGNLEILKESTKDETLLAVVDDIFKGTTATRELATRLGTYGKGASVVRVPMELQPWLSVVVRALGSANRSKIKLSTVGKPAWIKGDEAQLTQVLINLITNAFQASDRTAEVEIRLYNASDPTAPEDKSPEPLGKDGKWCIDVLDRGRGIAPDSAEKIFDPFFSTKPGGSGLGLTSCANIIQAHSGTIQALPREGRGCCMRVTIPADSAPMPAGDSTSSASSDAPPRSKTPQAAAPLQHSKTEGTLPLDGAHIVVMDDEPYVRETLARLLASSGATVHSTSCGEEVIGLYKELRTKGLRPTVLLDLNIERGLDGIPTLERLLEFDPNVRAVACSGYSEVDIAHDHEIIGFKGYLAKPFKTAELIDTLLAVGSQHGE